MEGVRCEHLGSAYTRIPGRRWKWQPWESVGEADGNLGRPRGRRSWSLRPRMPPCGKT